MSFYSIDDFGAHKNSKELSTAAITGAIQAASEAGAVLFIFLPAPIVQARSFLAAISNCV